MNDDVDRVLVEAGDRWRAAQPPAPSIDPELFVNGSRGATHQRRWLVSPMALAGVILVILASFAFGRITVPGSSAGTGPGGSGLAAMSPPAATSPPVTTSPTPDGTPTPACEVTRPDPVYFAPTFPRTPPSNYGSDWYGSEHLWTMLDRDGEVWNGWVAARPPMLPQKTFWWSVDWKAADEPQPTIIVTGRRLDGPGSFTFGPGTNASADFGTAMLVGIDIPSYGCWELTARYRLATLSYVVSVVGP